MVNETTTDAIEQRVSRARDETLAYRMESDDPLVVTVDNVGSDTTHTVVPNIAHCSCADHTYRGYMCKHILFLMDQDTSVGESVREAIGQHKNALESEASEIADDIQGLEDQLVEVDDDIEQVVAARNALDLSHLSQDEADDIAELLNEAAEIDPDGAEPPVEDDTDSHVDEWDQFMGSVGAE